MCAQKLFAGKVVKVATLQKLLATNDWTMTRISQTIDGKSYWMVENDQAMDYCLIPISECDEIGLMECPNCYRMVIPEEDATGCGCHCRKCGHTGL